MSDLKRITIWVFLLIGSSFLFYLWSHARIKEINESVYVVDSYIPIVKNNVETKDYYSYASSTLMQVLLDKDLNKEEWSTSTLKISTSTIDDTDFNFKTPDSKSVLYAGCTYNIELDLGADFKPNYLGIQLFDFGTQKNVDLKSSGLVNSLTIKDSVFKWSVGDIWPGDYYLFIPMINGLDVKIKSKKFHIEKRVFDEKC